MIKDVINKKFGRWYVTDIYEKRKSDYYVKCICECGTERYVRQSSLISGDSLSCGCLRIENGKKASTKHNGFGTKLYNIWDSMRQRCNNPKCKAYENYGKRNIKICKEWNDYNEFRKWALKNGYDESLPKGQCTLDRINVNKDYEPSNCRWTNRKEQNRNKQNTIYLTYQGETHSMIEWSEKLGLSYQMLWRRKKYGWTDEEILSIKPRKINNKKES